MIGIYTITNRVTGKVYVGQSKDIARRWRAHRVTLQHNKCSNPYLQRAWNKAVETDFVFAVVQQCPERDLDALEAKYIAKFQSLDRSHGYNLLTVVAGSKRHSMESRSKIAASLKGKRLGVKASSETKARMSVAHKGHVVSAETKAKMSAASSNRTPETLEKLAIAGRNRTVSTETRAKIAASKTGKSTVLKGVAKSPEQKAKIAESIRLWHAYRKADK